MPRNSLKFIGSSGSILVIAMSLMLAACATPASTPTAPTATATTPDVTFTLETGVSAGRMAFIGKGGSIDGVVNPTFSVKENALMQVTLTNGDGIEHDVVIPDFKGGTKRIVSKGSRGVTVFRADKRGSFSYYCSVTGHRQAGMEGVLSVGQ